MNLPDDPLSRCLWLRDQLSLSLYQSLLNAELDPYLGTRLDWIFAAPEDSFARSAFDEIREHFADLVSAFRDMVQASVHTPVGEGHFFTLDSFAFATTQMSDLACELNADGLVLLALENDEIYEHVHTCVTELFELLVEKLWLPEEAK